MSRRSRSLPHDRCAQPLVPVLARSRATTAGRSRPRSTRSRARATSSRTSLARRTRSACATSGLLRRRAASHPRRRRGAGANPPGERVLRGHVQACVPGHGRGDPGRVQGVRRPALSSSLWVATTLAVDDRRLRLHDVPGRQVLRPRPAGAGEHLALVPARREDRRARPERRRQVDAAADHGRPRGAVVGRRRARARARPSGCSSRSPSSTRRRTCAATSRTASAQLRDLLDRFNAISAAFAEPDADFDALLAEQARCRTRSTVTTPGASTRTLDRAMDALRLPGGRPRRDDALGRRAAPRRALPAAALVARPAAPRRADEPPRRRVGRVARALPRRLQGHGRSRSPTTATSSTTSPAGSSSSTAAAASRSRATTRRGSSRSRRGSRVEEKQESARRRTLARELEWVRMSPRARHAKSKARLAAYERLLAEEQT